VSQDYVTDLHAYGPTAKVLPDIGDSALGHHSVEHVMTRPPGPVDPVLLEKWLGTVMWDHACGRVYRVKGLLMGKEDKVYVVQGVGDLFEVVEVLTYRLDFEPKVLFIGRGLDKQGLALGLAGCVPSE
jgi:G3E family GTPase